MRRIRRLVAAVTVLALSATGAVMTARPDGSAEAYTTVVYNGAGSAPRIGVIGDSTIAALRWSNQFGPLQRFNFVYDAESCRRTATPSCRGREGYQPENVITTMQRLSGRWGSVLVIMGGYDDPGYGFGSAVDAVMAEASRQGIPTVMWLTMRTADVSYVGPTYASNTYTFRDNNRILLAKAAQYGDRLQIADWATHSARQSSWFYADGIHMTAAGANAAASYIATTAARLLGGTVVTPPLIGPARPWAALRYGDRGSNVAEAQRALALAGYNLFGGVSGVYGATTKAAVIRFQQAYRLPITGIVDAATAHRLGLVNYSGVTRPPAWRPLQLSMSGRGVAAAQQRLAQLGYYPFPASGVFGPTLRAAVMEFQRDQGLPATGVIDEGTAKRLTLYSGTWTNLRPGLSGARVEQAQRALVAAGVPLSGGVNGLYGERMAAAVRDFQKAQGLPITGVIDGPTAIRLRLFRVPERVSVWVNLTVQTVNPAVGSVQRALMARGYQIPGGATNVFDMATRGAVMAFQRANGLTVSGVVDGPTAQRLGLFDMSPTATWQTIYLYTTSSYVAHVERALIAAGYSLIGADNVFDRSAYLALRSFQAAHGLPVNGAVTWATARALGIFGAPMAAQVLLLATPAATVAEATTTTTTTTIPEEPSSSVEAIADATVGDFVWLDVDGDGLQDPDEVGVADVTIRLVNEAGEVHAETRSDEQGEYRFEVTAGRFLIEVDLPEGLVPTVAHLGDDDSADADLVELDEVRQAARTETFEASEALEDVDVGFVYKTDTGEVPTTGGQSVPSESSDGSTGESAPPTPEAEDLPSDSDAPTAPPDVLTPAPATVAESSTTASPTVAVTTTTSATTTITTSTPPAPVVQPAGTG